MRFEPESIHGANNGLNVARGLVEKVKTKFPWISYGDLWTLAGVAAIQVIPYPVHLKNNINSIIVGSEGNGWAEDSLEAWKN